MGMNLFGIRPRHVFWVDGVLATLGGLGYLLGPDLNLALLGVHTDPARALLLRLFGASFLGNGVTLLLSARLAETPAGIANLRGVLVWDVAGVAVLAYGAATGVLGPAAWVLAAAFLPFLALRVHFGFLARREAAPGPGRRHPNA